MEKQNIFLQPYPEIIISPFRKKNKTAKSLQQFSSKLCIMLTCIFIFSYFIVAFINKININFLDFFIDTPIYSFKGFCELFSTDELNDLTYISNLANTYYIVTIIVMSFLLLIFKKILNAPNKIKIFSLTSLYLFLFATALSFFVDLIISLLVKTLGIVYIEVLSTETNILLFMNITFGFLGNFLFYFIMDDISEVLVNLILSPIVLFILINNFNFNYFGFLTMIILTYGIKMIVMGLDKIGFINKISKFIIKWCYTPKYIFKAGFIVVIFVIKLILPKNKKNN